MDDQKQLLKGWMDEESAAYFSPDRKYRYVLTRKWDMDTESIMFIGLNPSTANETDNDPTIRRLIKFAKDWGYGGMYMTNLFAYVSTDPDKLITSGEKISINDHALKTCADLSDKVVFAWGCFKQHKKRMEDVVKMFPEAFCIGDKSKEGFPKHPLYLPGKLTLQKWQD